MKTSKKPQEQIREFETSDFIPYACHYNHDTILTKNGELIQFIRFDGDGGYPDPEFREAVRDTLKAALNPKRHAVWLHTLRTREEVKTLTANDTSKRVELEWRKNLPKKLHYDNCIYISVLHDSIGFKPYKPQNFLRGLSFSAESKHYNRVLAENEKNLREATDQIEAALKKFGSKRLKTYKKSDAYYSEPMEFLRRILCFYDDHVQIPFGDLSQNLIPHKINFSTYTGQIELKSERGMMHGAVITLKETANLPARALDEFLNMDSEIVVSQALEFATSNTYLHFLEYQRYMSSLDNDKDFAKISGLNNLDLRNPDDFAVEQTNIIIMQPTRELLQKKLEEIYKMLSDMGIVGIIEDLRVERSFWGILPGNFSFLKRQNLVTKRDMANFANLGNDIFDVAGDSFLRTAVTFFETTEGDAFPFHLLAGGSGNVLSISDNEEDRTSLIHLIALHAHKFGARIIYYDAFGKYQAFAKSIEAEYLTNLDLDHIRDELGSRKTIVVLNSIKQFLENGGEDFLLNFAEYADANQALVIAGVSPEENCQKLLVDFETQFFFEYQKIADHADNFDLYDDEIDIIEYLGDTNLYMKHNNEEMNIKFAPEASLKHALLNGIYP